MAIKKNLTYLLIIILSFLMMPLKSFGVSLKPIHSMFTVINQKKLGR